MNAKCPQCQSEAVMSGKIYNQIDYINPPSYFKPDGFSVLAFFKTNVFLPNHFLACTCCGTIWSKIDAQQLQRLMAGKGSVYELK